MGKLVLRLGDELSAAQQLAGVTDEDFRRVEAECATAAGLRQVERRVNSVVKGQFDALSEVPEQVPVTKTLNKRLRKKKSREAAAMELAVREAAAEAVDAVLIETATEVVLHHDAWRSDCRCG